jgi:electron transfer flavoprotein beta subunit
MQPYLLAERLGWPLVTGIAAIELIDGDEVTLLQAFAKARRGSISE